MGAYHSNSLLAARYRRIIIHDITNKVTMLSILFIRVPCLQIYHFNMEEHGFSLTKIPIVLCIMSCNYYRGNNQQPIVKQINCHLGNWVIGVEACLQQEVQLPPQRRDLYLLKEFKTCIKITQVAIQNYPRNNIQIQFWKMPIDREYQHKVIKNGFTSFREFLFHKTI